MSASLEMTYTQVLEVPTWKYFVSCVGSRGSVVGWGTMLQAGRSQVGFPVRSLDFSFSWPNPSSCTVALGSTQPLTEMNTRNLPGGKGRPAHKANNLTAICEPIVLKVWASRRLTTLWASTASYRGSFGFFYLSMMTSIIIINIL
jgi:hypothetical protein